MLCTDTKRVRLVGEVLSPCDISSDDRHAMKDLLDRYFFDLSDRRFESDLDEKRWAVLLRDGESGAIKGFTTLCRVDASFDDEPFVGLFSGDTIVDKACWGQTELARVWARHVFQIAKDLRDEGAAVYWFLISSGYKTYRFLPIFFRQFYPSHDSHSRPQDKRRLDIVASQKFGDQYDAATGIIRLRHPTPLRPGVADVTEKQQKDPHIAHFLTANPGYRQGDDLACLAKIDDENLTRAAWRILTE